MQKKMYNLKPLLLLLLLNILGMALVVVNKGLAVEKIAVLCGIVCSISLITYFIITLRGLGDAYLFIIVSMLGSLGIIMQTRINPGFGMKQMIMYLAGVVCFFVALTLYRKYYKNFKSYTLLFWGGSIALFLLTIIFGKVTNGATNWIVITDGLTVQPAEIIRILFVLSLAAIFTNARRTSSRAIKSGIERKEAKKLRQTRLILAAVIAMSNAMFLFFQREWGMALLFFAIYIAYLYIYGESKFFLCANLLMVLFAAFIGLKFMSHIQVRVNAWMDPFFDPHNDSYQILQSLIAIAEGGFVGSGIGAGFPEKIPEVRKDFAFSAICEEMGIMGGVAVIMLYFVLVYRGFKIALSCTNMYNKAVAVGLSVMLGVQTFIIVGGGIKLIPHTGITLPFISYGGSSMVTTFMVVGILQAISSVKGEITDEIE